MKSRDIASLAFKIIGIVTLVQSMSFVYIMSLALESFDLVLLRLFILFGLYLGLGLVLILASKKIAKLVCKENNNINIPCTAKELQTIAFSCIGLWLICSSASNLLANIMHSLKALQSVWATQNVRFLMPKIFQMLIGIALFVQSRGLATLWEKLNKNRNPVRKD